MLNRKTVNLIITTALIVSAAVLIVSSCRKDEKTGYNNFISKDLAVSYSTTLISSMLDNVALIYPEVTDIKPFINLDINVYKMVYSTTIDGEKIEASGLVCIPGTPGEYPVMSFQNGTNTVNDYAPSNYVLNPVYQLAEFIASTGFVVIIPDYPGFGSSAGIPHPYLVKEPIVKSIVDMMRALKESMVSEFPGVTIRNEYYLMGYSLGGWATLALHKALELDYNNEFNLAGSVCGAGPYNIYTLFQGLVNTSTYPMPAYFAFIINAYTEYHLITNTVSELLNEPYSSRLSSLFLGNLSLDQINSQLTTSVPGLLKPEFISGFVTSPSYSSVRAALINNSISPWNTSKSLLLVHGGSDTQVSVTTTETMYNAMLDAGTPASICKKTIFPGLDHGDAVVPSMTTGLLFLLNLRGQ